ncbi:PaaI family thioesterase [Cupriavidus sp. AU9028]|uniref:PaaI family thioesterase n=1 Tax=Cupriavidus sp. AU9028 TaxID=2871157 RepID=UPI001C953301|nr:PaaI family thioesterase [Cupriavidus sp. AU9028]MBY4897955.1 PaaI family thioesterase [Cupriavidus sp. AU9028]
MFSTSAVQTDAQPVPERLRALIEAILMQSPVARSLGVMLDSLAPEHVELRLPFNANNVTMGNTVHGGVIATLIDIAGAAAAASGADVDELKGGATSSLSIQYLAPAQGADLRAVAAVLRRGRRQVVTEVTVYAESDDSGTVVAKALMSSALF